MDFEPNEDQAAVLTGLEQLIGTLDVEPPKEGVFTAFNEELDRNLGESGFLQIAKQEGYSLLDAALIVERIARLPVSVEAAASALVMPLLEQDDSRPLALSRSVEAPARFLPQARALLVDAGDNVLLAEVEPENVEPIESLFAYPYGRLRQPKNLKSRSLGASLVKPLRRRWRLAIATEGAGLLQGALDQVVEHVKTRHQFGRPLGSFQAIQHRLAMVASITASARWLAFRGAWSDDEADCATAAAYVQEAIPKATYDLHQFSGAMGLTLEFPLHFWTYRLKALMSEQGGTSMQARAAALSTWKKAAS